MLKRAYHDRRSLFRSAHRLIGADDTWIRRVDANLRLVFRAREDAIHVMDLLDRRQFPAVAGPRAA